MRHFMTYHPAVDGGDPLDGDLDQMTDDGCPLVTDPAWWSTEDLRDHLGELDTFEDPPAGPNELAELARQPRSRPTAIASSRTLRCRTCGRIEPSSPDDLLLRFASRGRPECCGRVMDYFALPPPFHAVPQHAVAA
jgi:hypothetical protein